MADGGAGGSHAVVGIQRGVDEVRVGVWQLLQEENVAGDEFDIVAPQP